MPVPQEVPAPRGAAPARRLARLAPLLLVALAFLPLWGTYGHPDRFIGDPLGELPVKLWTLESFAKIGVLGGHVADIGFPNVGPLNNPDPAGTVLTALLRPLVGRIWAYNLLVAAQLAASMISAWVLARALVRDELAALTAAVTFGLSPLVLAYAVCGAVTDILNLWPYPLAVLGLVEALRAPTSRRAAAWGAFGGAAAGLGFVTCPYSFVNFAAMAFPAALLARTALRDGLVPYGDEVRPTRARAAVAIGAMVAAVAVIGGGAALVIHQMMADPSSQMSAEAVSATRHTPPFKFLEPGHRDRYVAWLSDWVAVGKGALIERVAASRFYRAFSPGFSVYGLVLAGVLLGPRRRTALLWVGVAAFCILASTGPFLPVNRDIYAQAPLNAAWLLTQYALPGGNLILEPFRYALPAALALGVAAAIGAHEVRKRLGDAVAALLPFLVVLEVVGLSPTPAPLPTATFDVPAVYARLDTLLPPGAIIELPYFDHGSDRMVREHFLHQLFHHRAIPNEVMGFAPRYMRENQFTARLLSIEKNTGLLKVEVTDPSRVDADRAKLATDGFVGFVVDPRGYPSDNAYATVARELSAFGTPIEAGDRRVWRIR